MLQTKPILKLEEDRLIEKERLGNNMSIATEFVKNIKVGVSIGDTLDSWEDYIPYTEDYTVCETKWGNPIIQEALIDAYLESGMNVIRIPVTWRNHINRDTFEVTENWMARVQTIVDYVYNKGAYVILNVHHEDWNFPYYDNQEAACEKMGKIWTQIATRFADYGERLVFEGQNEPRKIGTDVEWNGGDQEGWDVVNATNRAFISAVRNCGENNKNRFLMIPCYGANCTNGIKHITIPDDERLIVSVHAYEPYEFCLQIPGRDNWNQDTEKIDSIMKDFKELFLDKNIPVILGEFGAMNKNGNEEERAKWVEYYVKEAAKVGIPCVWWDNGRFEGPGENFGLFNRYDFTCTYPKILKGLTSIL